MSKLLERDPSPICNFVMLFMIRCGCWMEVSIYQFFGFFGGLEIFWDNEVTSKKNWLKIGISSKVRWSNWLFSDFLTIVF